MAIYVSCNTHLQQTRMIWDGTLHVAGLLLAFRPRLLRPADLNSCAADACITRRTGVVLRLISLMKDAMQLQT